MRRIHAILAFRLDRQQGENAMRKLALGLALVTAAAFAPRPAAAAYDLPWCAQYTYSNILSCAFTSHQQCMATVSGVGGFCRPNFRYPPQPPYAELRRAKPHRDSGYH
jgi:hypothetical protein